MRRRAWSSLLLGAAAVLAACGGDSGGAGNNPVLTLGKTASASGDNQTGVVGTALTNNLRVLVSDDGDPKSGQIVTWSTANGAVTPLQSTSDVNGVATTLWTLGTTSGVQTVTATLPGAVGSPLTFAALASPGPAAGVTPVSGSGQVSVTGTAFAQNLTVRVSDIYGNGVPGTVVDWVVASGPASTATASSTSNGQGIAAMAITAGGVPGPVVVQASLAGIGQTADFDLTVVPPAKQVSVGAGGLNQFQSVANGSNSPARDTVAVGQRVQWSLTSGSHNVTSQGSPSFSNSPNPMGASYSVQFSTAGSYNYFCSIHGASMSGIIVVQ